MPKILINNTASALFVADTGVSLPVGSYTIPAQEFGLWAASSDIISRLTALTVTVNDGSSNLSVADGTALLQGQFPSKISGGSTGAFIGNITDKLKVTDADANATLTQIANGLGVTTPAIFKRNEVSITTRAETDMANTTYTVPSGKTFTASSFSASYDAQAGVYVRLKKQTGGVGAWETLFRLNMMTGGQGNSTVSLDLSKGIQIGAAGDVFKITYESSILRGTLWASYSGSEF